MLGKSCINPKQVQVEQSSFVGCRCPLPYDGAKLGDHMTGKFSNKTCLVASSFKSERHGFKSLQA